MRLRKIFKSEKSSLYGISGDTIQGILPSRKITFTSPDSRFGPGENFGWWLLFIGTFFSFADHGVIFGLCLRHHMDILNLSKV